MLLVVQLANLGYFKLQLLGSDLIIAVTTVSALHIASSYLQFNSNTTINTILYSIFNLVSNIIFKSVCLQIQENGHFIEIQFYHWVATLNATLD